MSTENSDLREMLGELIARHGEKWLGFVRRVVKNPADAEDVVQDAVKRVLLRDLTFTSTDQAKMYLSRTIGNQAIERYYARRRERRRSVPLNDDRLTVLRNEDPHSCLEEKEQCEENRRLVSLVYQGLALLPVEQYEALRMTLLGAENSSIREAGAENNIPYSTLRHRRKEGIRKLRKHIRRALLAHRQDLSVGA